MSKRIVLLQALAVTVSNLERLLPGFDGQTRGYRPQPGMWSVADVLSHLVTVETQYLRRLQRVLAEERPFLPAILPDETTHNLFVSLDDFAVARQATLVLLREVAEVGWARTAVHETQGEVTFQALVQFLVDHDSEHLNQIAAIQQQLTTRPESES